MTEVAHHSWLAGGDELDRRAFSVTGEPSPLTDLAEQLGRIGHWWVRLSDHALTWSAEVYRIHGVTPEQYQPDLETAISLYHPDDRDAVRATFAAAADGTPFECSMRLIRADGELRHIKSRGVTIAQSDDIPALIFGVFIDITDEHQNREVLHQANIKLQQIAYVDAFILLANRRQFDEMLQREWRRAIREQTALSLVMVDLDRFKAFNDQYGHLAGDECLRAVAVALRSVGQRPGDLVARFGGEEFALILPVTEPAGAEIIARAARAAVAALGLTHAGNTSGGGVVTASLGVSTAYPQFGSAPDAWLGLIAEADGLLYEAKRTGRNRTVSATSMLDVGIVPANEAARLKVLAGYEQAGATRRTAQLDRIARLAATLTAAPIGLVSILGYDRQNFAGNFGLDGVDSTGRDVSFCAHTILGDDPFVVADAQRDIRFRHNLLVTGKFGLRYYAGAPIVSETTGYRLGAVCVIDTSARAETSVAQRALLTDLAKMAATLIEEAMAFSLLCSCET